MKAPEPRRSPRRVIYAVQDTYNAGFNGEEDTLGHRRVANQPASPNSGSPRPQHKHWPGYPPTRDWLIGVEREVACRFCA